ncbi:beta-galactosidase [bacterium]|nr:beta-galactosidase [bacterium]
MKCLILSSKGINLFYISFLLMSSLSFSERPKLKASDVVFMYFPKDPSLYDVYSGTVVGWAGRARSKNERDVAWFRKVVEEAHRRGLLYCGSVDFVVAFGGFIDFYPDNFMDSVCRDLDRNPITVPWLWDHKHKGHPAYWFCTNSPDYQRYLKDQVERACLAPIDGLHIDDWRGTAACSAWFGGCFCKHCKESFRLWLKKRFSKEELKSMGIDDIDNFDIQSFLKSKGVTAESWRKQRSQLPLGELYQKFQTEKMLEVVKSIFEYAEKLRGKPLLRSVNSSASSPEALVVAPLIDFFCGEMEHHASSCKVPIEPAFVFRLVEGLGKRQSATAGGYDWAWVAENNKPGLVRTWIAQAYAFGSLFMVPHNQWCYTQEKGTHWWEGKPSDFAFLYKFVRQNAKLFDDYKSLSDIALVYTTDNFNDIQKVGMELLKENIPFSILCAEPSLGMEINKREVAQYELLIFGKNSLPDKVKKQLSSFKGNAILWNGIEGLPKTFREEIKVSGSDKVRVSLRYKPKEANAPVVCHILNQDYHLEEDDVRPADVEISISLKLLSKALKKTPKEAMVYIPGRPAEKINLNIGEDKVSFKIDGLGLWAIVSLK